MRRTKAEPLGNLINQFLRNEGLETPLNEYRLVQAWPKVVGESITRFTGEIFISKGVLNVQIKSPALRQNLMMTRTTLTQRLNEYVGAQVITEVRFF